MRIKEYGFSLVEVMVALSLAAGIGLVIMKQQETSIGIQSKINSDQVVNSAVNTLQAAMSNKAICTKSLEGLGVGDPVNKIVNAKMDPLNHANLIEFLPDVANNSTVFPGDVKIQGMQIISHNECTPPQSCMNDYLLVNFNLDPNDRKKQFGGKVIGKRIRLLGLKDGNNKYISCYSEASNLLESALVEACTSIGGTWNPTTNKCDLMNLPNCIVTNESCRGRFNVNKGEWRWDVKIYGRKRCTQEYEREFITCGQKHFYRDCYCGGTTGIACNCDTGQVGCYSRTTMSCVEDPVIQEAVGYKCCQQ